MSLKLGFTRALWGLEPLRAPLGTCVEDSLGPPVELASLHAHTFVHVSTGKCVHVEGTTEENSRLQFQLLGNMEIQGSKLQKRTKENRPGFAEAMVSRGGASRAH